MKKLIIFLCILVLALMGCSSLTMEEQLEAQFYATQYAKDPSAIPPPKYQTLAATALGLRLPATPVPTSTPDPHFTPTMSFYDFSGTQVAQQQAINLTQGAQQLQVERERLAAEERAEREAEEAKRARETAVAYSHQQTAEARVWFAQQTAYAEGTAMMATAQAQATATMWAFQIHEQNTSVAGAATAQVQPTHAIWTQQAVNAIATIERGEADKVALAVERAEMENVFKAYTPWVLIIVVTYILGRGFAEFVKTRVHARDEHGRVPLLQMKSDSGDTIIVKAESLETGLMKVGKDGSVIRYAPMDKQEQSDITRRNQAIEAIAALPVPYAQKGPQMLGAEFGRSTPRVNFHSDTDRSATPVLDEADSQLMEASDE